MPSSTATFFQSVRDRIELGFSRWGEICHDHPWRIIFGVILVVGYFSSFLPNMVVDTSTEGYLHPDDPARLLYDDFQREFGKDERVVVLVQSDGDIVNEAFLRRLEKLHQALEKIPQVDKVDSLINARLTLGREDELIVKDLLEDWPQNEADFARLRTVIQHNPVYQKQFVNSALTSTVLVVTPDTYAAGHSAIEASTALDEFDFSAGFEDNDLSDLDALGGSDAAEPALISGAETDAILTAVRAAGDVHQGADFRIGLAGSAYMMHQMTYILGRDMFVFSFIGILIIAVLLLLIFRRWVMVILPISVSALSLYFTFTLMTFFGMAVTTSVQILPSLLLAVGVGNSVHIFTVYFQAIDRGQSKREALSYALGHSGLAVVMTGLTTAGGLVSFITANIKPVADIGIISPMGIICTLLFSLIFLPALIAISPLQNKGLKDDAQGLAQRFLKACADLSTTHPRRIVLAWAAVLCVCLLLVAQIRPSHYPLHWFPPSSDLRASTEAMDAQFGGGTFMEMVVDTGQENGLHNPALLHAVDEALHFASGLNVNGIALGKITSLLDINKELHQALNGNDPAYYRIPDDRALIAQELLLFENSGSDDLLDIVDTGFSKMRVTIKMPFVDGTRYPDYLMALETGVNEILAGQATVTFTGIIHMLAGTVKALIGDTIKAYLLAFLIIAPLMMLLVGSVRTGLISMIPNLAPIIVTLALMAVLNIPLDAFTLLIGSIALGLAVDDTIHFMHNFQRYYARSQDTRTAVRETLRTTGKAMMITSVVLSGAFFVNLFGTMINLQNFGLLTGTCIIVAFLADVLLAPALMTLLIQSKEKNA